MGGILLTGRPNHRRGDRFRDIYRGLLRFRSRTQATLHFALLGVVLGPCGWGCAPSTRHAANAGRLAAEAWPPRITRGLRALAVRSTGEVFQNMERDEEVVRRVRNARAYSSGLILEFEPSAQDRGGRDACIELAFVSFSPMPDELQLGDRRFDRLPKRLEAADLAAGTPWTLTASEHRPSRGLALLLGGNKYLQEELLKRGWIVLSTPGPGRYFQRRENPLRLCIEGADQLDIAAERIARAVDEELAEWAYAAEAVLEYLARTRGDLECRPAVVLGFSIGAVTLPTVVARLPDRFQAAVLIAGGADLLEISRLTSKEDRGLELLWSTYAPHEKDWAQLDQAYLSRTLLDPYHTATSLSGMPVLMYHAAFDRAVPARAGALLRERCPEARHVFLPVGHKQILRVMMRLYADSIADWLDKSVGGEMRELSAITNNRKSEREAPGRANATGWRLGVCGEGEAHD